MINITSGDTGSVDRVMSHLMNTNVDGDVEINFRPQHNGQPSSPENRKSRSDRSQPDASDDANTRLYAYNGQHHDRPEYSHKERIMLERYINDDTQYSEIAADDIEQVNSVINSRVGFESDSPPIPIPRNVMSCAMRDSFELAFSQVPTDHPTDNGRRRCEQHLLVELPLLSKTLPYYRNSRHWV
jgi:hypothetical protein